MFVGKINIYVDESGIIAKHPEKSPRYFVIALVFVREDDRIAVERLYKRETLKLIKRPSHRAEFRQKHELKGSDLTEVEKSALYRKLVGKYSDKVELGIIVLDNQSASEQLREVPARGFNFLIKEYLLHWFFSHSRFKDEKDLELNFLIDERNVATKAKATLKEYLNTELGIEHELISKDVKVAYCDSKGFYLIRLADFIANSVFRMTNKSDQSCSSNRAAIEALCCHGGFFWFPVSGGKA